MDRVDDTLSKQVAAILRVISTNRSLQGDNHPCQIEEGLFLGSIGAAYNKDELKRLNITHILTVASWLRPRYSDDFVYKLIAVWDKEETNITEHFEECFNFIDEAKRIGGGVLVHCFAGKSRSVTVTVAYLMQKCGMAFSQALEHVKSRRPQAYPNSGFIRQLREFEQSLQGNKKTAEA